MDRVEFLNARILALKQSIHRNRKMISLCEIVREVDANTQKADMAELQRRISIDQELLAVREAELGREGAKAKDPG